MELYFLLDTSSKTEGGKQSHLNEKLSLGNVVKGSLQKQSLKKCGQSITHHFFPKLTMGRKASSVSGTKQSICISKKDREEFSLIEAILYSAFSAFLRESDTSNNTAFLLFMV